MFREGIKIRTDVTVILRRDAGGMQYVLSEGPAGFLVTGMDMATSELKVVRDCDGLDDGIAKFRKVLDSAKP